MSVTYLTTPIEEVRHDPPPRGSGMTREGYTKRSGAPTSRLIRLQGEKRWRRLMVWQFSNLGTLFVNLNGKPHVVREEQLPKEGSEVHHARKKSRAQLDREIADALAHRPGGREGPRYYVAHPDEVAEVTIVFRGLGDYNVKRRYKKPVRVRNVSDGDEFFVEESEIFRDPVAAGVHSAELSRHHHSTRKGSEPIYTLSAEQIAALRTFAQDNGRNWKSELNHAWSTGDWSHDYADNAGLLQQIRNTFGPSWLVKFSFNNIKTHGVKR